VSPLAVPVAHLTPVSRSPHAMKVEALIFAIACFTAPAYGIYANAVGRQESMHHAKTLDSGEVFVDSEIALMRARFCQPLLSLPSEELAPTLIGMTGLALEDGDPGPQFVCALDGSTAKQVRGTFMEFAVVEENDLERFHKILKVRGLITDEHTAGYHHDSN